MASHMKATARPVSLVLLVWLPGLVGTGRVAQADGTEIQPGIYRMNGIEETLPTRDLKRLGKLLRGVDVVGLGEAVHTTRGFSRAKFRLFQYLVEKRGFRVFGFESPWVEAERVAAYVATCGGQAEQALGGLFGVWQNESVLELVRWMCDYNRDHPEDPVHFYGFDHQQGWDDAPRLKGYLTRFGIAPTSKRVKWLDDCEGATSASAADYDSNRDDVVPLDRHERCLEALAASEKFLDRRARRLIRRGVATAEEIEWARIHLSGLRACQIEIFDLDTDFDRSFQARDEAMAYIAAKIRELRFPEAKTALWAHNAHIAMGGGFVPGVDTMGVFLERSFGKRYQPIGLVALQSSIDWPGVGCGPLDPSLTVSVERRLSQLGEEFLFVDLDFPGTDEPFLEPGATYYLNQSQMVPREEFRALIYMETAEKMVPLAWAPCGP